MIRFLRWALRYKDHERWCTVKRRYAAALGAAVGWTMIGVPFAVVAPW